MATTSVSLLDRARRREDDRSWKQLAEIYTPLLRSWLGRHGLQDSDVDDLVQETLLTVARELPRFEHNGRTGAFRSWLRTIVVYRLHNYWRSKKRHPQGPADTAFLERLAELEDPSSKLSGIWNLEHDRHLLTTLLTVVSARHEAHTVDAFRRVVLSGEDAEQVASELGMSLNAVLIAKSRLLRELRAESRGLLEG